MKNLHNKSNRVGLTICALSKDERKNMIKGFEESSFKVKKGLQFYLKGEDDDDPNEQMCLFVNDKNGDFCIKKFTEVAQEVKGYQVSALIKFGFKELNKLKARKKADDLSISHLCGSLNCCNQEHICIERKDINDDREHHLKLLHEILDSDEDIETKLEDISVVLKYCKHDPKCASINK
jgi:hypothetical protein